MAVVIKPDLPGKWQTERSASDRKKSTDPLSGKKNETPQQKSGTMDSASSGVSISDRGRRMSAPEMKQAEAASASPDRNPQGLKGVSGSGFSEVQITDPPESVLSDKQIARKAAENTKSRIQANPADAMLTQANGLQPNALDLLE